MYGEQVRNNGDFIHFVRNPEYRVHFYFCSGIMIVWSIHFSAELYLGFGRLPMAAVYGLILFISVFLLMGIMVVEGCLSFIFFEFFFFEFALWNCRNSFVLYETIEKLLYSVLFRFKKSLVLLNSLFLKFILKVLTPKIDAFYDLGEDDLIHNPRMGWRWSMCMCV